MFFVLVFMAVIILIICSIKTVPVGKTYIVERMGQYYQTWEPGMHICLPFIDSVAKIVPMTEQSMEIMQQPVISNDNQILNMEPIIWFQVENPKLFAYSAENSLAALEVLTVKVLRDVMGKYTRATLFENPDAVKREIASYLFDAALQFGVTILNVDYILSEKGDQSW